MSTRDIFFDGQQVGNATFARDAATVARDGSAVAADDPRWDWPRAVSSVYAAETAHATEDEWRCFLRGRCGNGQHLSVWQSRADHQARAFDSRVQNSKAESWARGDGMDWLAPNDQEADERHFPKVGFVLPCPDQAYGCAVAICEWQDYASEVGTTKGLSVGLAQQITYADAFSATRTIHAELPGLHDAAEDEPYPHRRLRKWCASWTPIMTNGELTGAVISWADYINDSSISPEKVGGQAWVMEGAYDDQTGLWTFEVPNKVDEREAEDPHGSSEVNEHWHSAYTYIFDDGNRATIVGIGDGPDKSAIRLYRWDDPNDAAGTSFTVDSNFAGDASESEGTDFGHQPIGFAHTSDPTAPLAITDGANTQLIHAQASATPSTPLRVNAAYGRGVYGTTHSPVYAVPFSLDLDVGDSVRCLDYTAMIAPLRGQLDTESGQIPERAHTVCYSRTGESGTWIPMAKGGRSREVVPHEGCALIGSASSDEPDFQRVRYPADITSVEPLLVGPGGSNYNKATPGPSLAQTGTTITTLSRVGGVWMDTDGETPLDPQPPCDGPVFRVTATTPANYASSTDYAARLRFATTGTGTGFPDGPFGLRYWLLPADKTQAVDIMTRIMRGTQGGISTRQKIIDTEDWSPILVACEEAQASGPGIDDPWLPLIGISPVYYGTSNNPRIPLDIYIACDRTISQDTNDNIEPGYPLPASDTVTLLPDETLTATMASPAAWTVMADLHLPVDAADSYWGVPPRTGGTLAEGEATYLRVQLDSDNRLDLVLDRENKQWIARVTNDGAAAVDALTISGAWLSADLPFHVRMIFDGTTLACAIRQCGNEVVSGSTTSDVPDWEPVEASVPGVSLCAVSGLRTMDEALALSDLERWALRRLRPIRTAPRRLESL